MVVAAVYSSTVGNDVQYFFGIGRLTVDVNVKLQAYFSKIYRNQGLRWLSGAPDVWLQRRGNILPLDVFRQYSKLPFS